MGATSSSPSRKNSNNDIHDVPPKKGSVPEALPSATLIPGTISTMKKSSTTTPKHNRSQSSPSTMSADSSASKSVEKKGSFRLMFTSRTKLEMDDKKKSDDKTRILLYGSENSGKTTLIRALKLLYTAESNITPQERQRRVEEIRKTVILQAREVVNNADTLSWSPVAAHAAHTFISRTSNLALDGGMMKPATSRFNVACATPYSDDEDDGFEDGVQEALTISPNEKALDEINAEENAKKEAKTQATSLIPKVTRTATTATFTPNAKGASLANISTSFNTTVTSDVGRIVYHPKKHSEPILVVNNVSDVPPKKGSASSTSSKPQRSVPETNTSAEVPIPFVPILTSPKKSSGDNSLLSRSEGTSPTLATPRESEADEDVSDLPVAEHVAFDAEIVDSLKVLFSCEEFHQARLQAPVDGLSGADNLVDNLDKIASPSYNPGADYLCARTTTAKDKQVTEISIQSSLFQICDMSMNEGKLPSDWNKDDVTAVVFLAACDIYDQPSKVAETNATFKYVCKKYSDKPIILLLNKQDLLYNKLRYVPFYEKGMRNDGYKGPRPENAVSQQEFDSAVKEVKHFVSAEYHRMWKKKSHEKGEIYIHFTTSTAPEQINAIFKATKDSLIRNNLKFSGFA